jgi:MerR family copper efflux transcriptional regulator
MSAEYSMPSLSIGRLAKLANVSIDTIRFYEKAGLLVPHVRRPSGFREYSKLDLKRLRFIRCGRLLGFSLEDIRELLALEDGHGPAASVIQQQLRVIDRRIEALKRWRHCLIDFVDEPITSASRPHSILDGFTEESVDPETFTLTARAPQERSRDCNDQN